MIGNILTIVFFLLCPACVLWLCRRFPLLDKIGPVLILYIMGIIFGNLFHPSGMADVQDVLSSATVPLAIPLMLFSCTFQRSKTRSQLIALLLGLAAVTISVIVGYFLFGRNMEDGAKIGGMLTGVYTGGTINLASLKVMLGVSEETFILLNSFDMAVSFLYLTFLLSVGIRMFRRWLPAQKSDDDLEEIKEQEKEQPFKGLFTRQGLRDAGFLLAVDALIIGISAGLGLLAGDGAFMTVLILSLTTLGIVASFWRPIKKRKYGYEIGMYCIYVFSVVVASMADLRSLSISGSLNMLGYLTFVIFFSLLLEVLAAKPFKVDADTMTVSSVAYICSPPFVPMMVAAMKNKSVLAGGLSVGVVGYAVGNYLGFLIARLLETL